MAGLPQHSQIASRVILDHHREMHLAFHVLLDRFHGGELAFEREIENVCATPGAQPHQVAFLHFDALNAHPFEFGIDRVRIPVRSFGCLFPTGGRPQPAKRAVKFHQLLGRHAFRAFQHLARPFIAFPDFGFLLVGQGQNTERKDLIDFKRVE